MVREETSEKIQTFLFFQIVLPSQAREMYEVVKNKGLPTALIMYEGKDAVIFSLQIHILSLILTHTIGFTTAGFLHVYSDHTSSYYIRVRYKC